MHSDSYNIQGMDELKEKYTKSEFDIEDRACSLHDYLRYGISSISKSHSPGKMSTHSLPLWSACSCEQITFFACVRSEDNPGTLLSLYGSTTKESSSLKHEWPRYSIFIKTFSIFLELGKVSYRILSFAH